MSQTDQLDAAEQITCPHLLIEAEEGAKFDPEIFQKILQVTKTKGFHLNEIPQSIWAATAKLII